MPAKGWVTRKNQQLVTMPDVCGLYQIRNLLDGKRYGGSAMRSRRRLRGHLNALRRGIHVAKRLQRAWNRDGADAFVLELVKIVDDPNQLYVHEQGLLDEIFASGLCYNYE